jgi:hypothetical protein
MSLILSTFVCTCEVRPNACNLLRPHLSATSYSLTAVPRVRGPWKSRGTHDRYVQQVVYLSCTFPTDQGRSTMAIKSLGEIETCATIGARDFWPPLKVLYDTKMKFTRFASSTVQSARMKTFCSRPAPYQQSYRRRFQRALTCADAPNKWAFPHTVPLG